MTPLTLTRRLAAALSVGALALGTAACDAGQPLAAPATTVGAAAGVAPTAQLTMGPAVAGLATSATEAGRTVALRAGAAEQAANAKAGEKAAAARAAKVEAARAAAAKVAAGRAADDKRKAAQAWTVTRVVDGDTIRVTRGGGSSTVRIIGIDTPERGVCGYSEASTNLRRIIGGRQVVLTPGARDGVDRYGRLLRYVDVAGVDAGLRQVTQGYAVARYDSRDGYGRHTRETAYVRADRSSPKAACAAPSGNGASPSTSGKASTATTSPRNPSASSRPTGSWPLAGDRYPCPQSRPIKGNEGSMIAHRPGNQSYNATKPEQCFASMGAAQAAGFRPAKV